MTLRVEILPANQCYGVLCESVNVLSEESGDGTIRADLIN